MSKYEERAFQVGRKKPNAAELKNRLLRLKHDLEQFTARGAGAAVVSALRQQIHTLEQEIAESDAARKRERERQQHGYGQEGEDAPAAHGGVEQGGRVGMRTTAGHFPPRGRPTSR